MNLKKQTYTAITKLANSVMHLGCPHFLTIVMANQACALDKTKRWKFRENLDIVESCNYNIKIFSTR